MVGMPRKYKQYNLAPEMLSWDPVKRWKTTVLDFVATFHVVEGGIDFLSATHRFLQRFDIETQNLWSAWDWISGQF